MDELPAVPAAGKPMPIGHHHAGKKVVAAKAARAAELARLSTAGDLDACLRLGEMYEDGVVVPQSLSAAASFYRKSATAEDEHKRASALFRLGRVCLSEGSEYDEKEALRCFKEAAEVGHTGAAAYLGYMYVEGVGVTKNGGKGLDLLRASAAKGNPSAHFYLSGMYANGQGVDKDADAADYHLRIATEKGFGPAVLLTSVQQATTSLQDESKLDRAIDGLRSTVRRQKGEANAKMKASASFNLALLLWKAKLAPRHGKNRGRETPDPTTAKLLFGEVTTLLRKAAEEGMAEAAFCLSSLYQKGVPPLIQASPASAAHYLAEAEKGGHAAAKLKRQLRTALDEIETVSANGGHGRARVPPSLLDTLKKAYDSGMTSAAQVLAMANLEEIGSVLEEDGARFEALALADKVEHLLETAASGGSKKAAYLLGLLLSDADTSPLHALSLTRVDLTRALKMFTIAASDGDNLDALYHTAMLLLHVSEGGGGEKEGGREGGKEKGERQGASTPESFTEWEDKALIHKRVVELLIWAAHGSRSHMPLLSTPPHKYKFSGGHAGAAAALACVHLGTLGLEEVPEDDDKAFAYAERAAHLSDPRGMSMLGEMYMQGRGVEASLEEAKVFFYCAIDAAQEATRQALSHHLRPVPGKELWQGVLPSLADVVGRCQVRIASILTSEEKEGRAAFELLQLASSYPHSSVWKAEATLAMARARVSGFGVSKSLAEAVQLCDAAAKMGHAYAEVEKKKIFEKYKQSPE
eukprot:CAMPEP_0113902280 /NCGR_PEP_ID=MMETSP0780_2-20120614/21756_1 /TAXON_ID=652834 /ORGANISM="Palpitomonas bilix" /LENGTH=752 /DNA_ID=CAMNT_0000895055 /DNA_START=236 /DNA_END=2494 /DNA_ORIENTATION=+ /assembly_acc=CAM_ASM_000599